MEDFAETIKLTLALVVVGVGVYVVAHVTVWHF
jgi:hypothetical protein